MEEKARKISEEDIRHVAQLARLHIEPGDVSTFTRQMGEILSYVEKLDEADTRDVPAAAHVLPICNALREDEVRPSLDPEDVLKNAPKRDGQDFLVPRVIG